MANPRYKKIPLLTALAGALIFLAAHDIHRFANLSQSADAQEEKWVDSVFNALSDEERLGQLFMLRAHSDKDTAYERQVEDLIRKYKPGGLCFFNPTYTGTPEKHAELTNRYQLASPRVPLMIAMDFENGVGMRYRGNALSFPRAMMLGAIQDNRLLYDMGREVARECRRMGVHVNFAPVADVNNNPGNPVIGERSYGEDRYNVAAKAFQYMSGLQDGGVLASVKHFPGHGDTDMDSHFDLPPIPFSRARLDSLELYPFRMLAKNGAGSIMVAHLQVNALDARENRPTTLSRATVKDLLRNEMGFEGLIFTDAMEMEGVKKFFPNGIADVEAFKAGNDVSLLPVDVGASIAAIQLALSNGSLDRSQLWTSVKRVLRAKFRLGLTKPQQVDLTNLRQDLNPPEAYTLKHRIVSNALILVRDEKKMIGFPNLDSLKFATLAIGDSNRTVFQTYCGQYAPMSHFNTTKDLSDSLSIKLLDTLRKFDVVLVGLYGIRTTPRPNRAVNPEPGPDTIYGLTHSELDFLRKLNQRSTIALTVFGNPYTYAWMDAPPLLLQAFTEDPMAQQLAAQSLFGATDLNGIMPVTAAPWARFGQGTKKIFHQKRLGYALPESVGMNSDTLALMDDIVSEMISTGAVPGCQILVAKDNKIVWQKSYGHYTYEQTQPVTNETIYDLASVTKVAATTISMMKLTENQEVSLDSPMSNYVPELKFTNKKDLTVREIMAHHAGLQAWIPFYQQTLTVEKMPSSRIYLSHSQPGFEVPVAKDLFMENAWSDTVWAQVFNAPLSGNKNYKYSDFGLYLCARAVDNLNCTPVDVFADQEFYRPLGLATTTFNPWKKDLSMRCAPTEEDGYFRHQRLQGYVHDMGAAMLGGVGGHAGLFSNANDLAKIFQMLLNGGSYGLRQYLQPETVRQFTTRYSASTRRGIGFDMKELDEKATANMSLLAGNSTFGHLGFTGICAWADPDKKLIFIFLSNRTYPTMENSKLMSGDFRPRLQSVVYRAIR
ncbi:MAG: glycoside hydrolase family 3 N-terminal domain-containing protein [Saprospiraceae bacterium]|nr:glycoside hydrolase family 3 N-terminal domain-containing protein [Saprospiraceae bacterium]